MSELAFTLNGEPFEIPHPAVGWRVRKLKPKGAPEIVYGRDGIPLTLPIDADMDDLRREARLEGRYRLDPVDDHGRTLGNVPAGYVCIHAPEHGTEPPAAPVNHGHGPQDPVVEAMRMNTELARTIIDRFPLMVESVAGLVRSAGDVGLPTRALHGLLSAGDAPDAQDDDSGDRDDAEDDDAPPSPTGWAAVIEQVAPQILAGLKAAVASGAIKIPGGLGALFDCRLASAAGAAEARAANAQGAPPAPGPRDPASARSGSKSPRPASAPHAPANTAATPRPPNPEHDPARSTPRSAGDTVRASSPASTPAMPSDIPALDPAALAHLTAVRAGLTAQEQALAQALLGKFSPAELHAWLTELKTMSVRDAIAEVRAVLGTDGAGDDGTSPGTSGGAS
jgi:hypothetical protein